MPLSKFSNIILIYIFALYGQTKETTKLLCSCFWSFLSRLMTPLHTQKRTLSHRGSAFQTLLVFGLLLPSIRDQKMHFLLERVKPFSRTVTTIKKYQITSHLPLYGQQYNASFLRLNKRRKKYMPYKAIRLTRSVNVHKSRPAAPLNKEGREHSKHDCLNFSKNWKKRLEKGSETVCLEKDGI